MIEERQRFPSGDRSERKSRGGPSPDGPASRLHEERFALSAAPAAAGHQQLRHVKGFLEERLPRDVRDTLKAVGAVADEPGFGSIWSVGSSVTCSSRVRTWTWTSSWKGTHHLFRHAGESSAGPHEDPPEVRTAVVVLPDGSKARYCDGDGSNYYDSPAALPTVELSSIKKDLYRRTSRSTPWRSA